MDGEDKILLILLLFVLIGVADKEGYINLGSSLGVGSLNIGNSGGSSVGIGTISDAPSVQYRTFSGNVEITFVHLNPLDTDDQRQEGIDVITKYYRMSSDDQYKFGGLGSVQGFNVDDNKFYFTVEPMEGKNLFISPLDIYDANPRVISYDYVDVDNDNEKEWIFLVDLYDLDNIVDNSPKLYLYTFSYDDAYLLLNSPSDIDVKYGYNIQTFIKWEHIVDSATTVPIIRYKVTFDTTDMSFLHLGESTLDVPNLGRISLSDFEKTLLSSESRFEYKLGNEFYEANYVVTPKNGDTNHPTSLKLLVSFDSDSKPVKVKLELLAVKPDQSWVSVTDSVTLIPSPSGQSEIKWDVSNIPDSATIKDMNYTINWET